jgi:hypothetical protein
VKVAPDRPIAKAATIAPAVAVNDAVVSVSVYVGPLGASSVDAARALDARGEKPSMIYSNLSPLVFLNKRRTVPTLQGLCLEC